MKLAFYTLVFSFATAAACSAAQTTQIPFGHLETAAYSAADSLWSDSNPEAAPATANGELPAVLPSVPASAAAISPVLAPQKERVVTRGFIAVNGLHLASAFMDTASTQHCMATGTCSEGNPIMPHSWAGMVTFDVVSVSALTTVSYFEKKHHSKLWMEPALVGIGVHAIGVWSGMRTY